MTDAEKSARVHFLTAAAVGFVVFILCAWFRFPGLNPETWGDVAAAAGLRPPARLLGGMVRAFDTVVFGLFEPLTAIRVLRLAGWATGGLVAYLAYHVLMDYFLNEEYTRADPYLKRVLEVRPDDPAVLNNLAVIQLRLYRYDEAEKYARAALDRWPNSPQIQKTLAAILKARPQRADSTDR